MSISTQFSSIWSIDRILSGATTLSQSRPGSDGSKGVLCIPYSSSITGASPSDCLVSQSGHSLEEGVISLCRDAVSIFYCPSWLGHLLLDLPDVSPVFSSFGGVISVCACSKYDKLCFYGSTFSPVTMLPLFWMTVKRLGYKDSLVLLYCLVHLLWFGWNGNIYRQCLWSVYIFMLSANYSFTNHIYNIYMYKQDLAINNYQRLRCNLTK